MSTSVKLYFDHSDDLDENGIMIMIEAEASVCENLIFVFVQ